MTSLELLDRPARARAAGILAVAFFTILCSAAAAQPPQPVPKGQAALPAGAFLRLGGGQLGHVGQLAGLGLLDNGKRLLTSAKDDTLRLWDLESGKLTGQIVAPHSRPKSIAVAPDGKLLAVLTPGGMLQILELPAGKLLKEWQAETVKNVGSVAVSPDGKWVASNGMNTKLWDVASGIMLQHFKHVPEPMGTLAFSPDGKKLAMGSVKGMIRLWDTHNGQELAQLAGHTQYIDQVAFTPDGELLASISHDGTARIWDLHTSKEIRALRVGFGVALALSRDGRSLAAGGETAGFATIWEVASGKERARFRGDGGAMMALLFAPNCKTLVSGLINGTALCWDLTGRRPEAKEANKARSSDELEKEWQRLGGEDARQAFQAMWVLSAAPEQTVARVRKELQPAKAVDDKTIARYITDLDADSFDVRENASAELRKAGELAWPALRKALEGKLPFEAKSRAQSLLELRINPDLDQLRLVRSLELLEHVNTKEAQVLLQELSKGAPRAWLTLEAKRILERVNVNN